MCIDTHETVNVKLAELDATLLFDGAQGSDGYVSLRVRYSHKALECRMTKVMMAALLANEIPTGGLDLANDVSAFHTHLNTHLLRTCQ